MSQSTFDSARLSGIRHLLEPKRIAIIGASRSPNGYGNKVIRHLKAFGFPGEIIPVNRNADQIEGLRSYPEIGDIPGEVDCALIVIPAAAVVDAFRSCAAGNVRSAVIGTVGFAETGTPEGIARQQELVRIGNESGLRFLGPNTNGIFNAAAQLPLGYNSAFADFTAPGPVSVVAHSGALFGHLAGSMARLGISLSKYVPVGNEADLTLLDFLEYLIEDADTKVIGLIIEGIGDAARFRRLAERAHVAGKPIVALKLGRSSVGAGASLAHSSRLAGSDRAYASLFRSAGIATVPSVEAMAAASLFLCHPARNLDGDTRMIGISSSGAGAALLADLAADRGIPLAVGASGNWEPDVARGLATVETNNPLRNPIDTGSLGGQRKLAQVFKVLESHRLLGPTLIFTHILQRPGAVEAVLANAVARQERTRAPVALLSPAGLGEETEARYREGSIAVFRDTAACFDGLKAWYDVGRNADAFTERLATKKPVVNPPRDSGMLTEAEASALLRQGGIPMVSLLPANNSAELAAAAKALGFPLVLKALVPDIAHKAKAGLVITGIEDSAGLARAHERLATRVEALGHAPSAIAMIVQPMISAKAELIAGISREEGIGHFLVAGMGGVYTEIFDSAVLFPIPSSRNFIRAGLAETTAGRLLMALAAENAGGDVFERFLDIFDHLQALAADLGDRLDTIDINPVLVGDQGCTAVDALIVLRPALPRDR